MAATAGRNSLSFTAIYPDGCREDALQPRIQAEQMKAFDAAFKGDRLRDFDSGLGLHRGQGLGNGQPAANPHALAPQAAHQNGRCQQQYLGAGVSIISSKTSPPKSSSKSPRKDHDESFFLPMVRLVSGMLASGVAGHTRKHCGNSQTHCRTAAASMADNLLHT